MMTLFTLYWEFISRALPSSGVPTAMDVIPDFYRKTFIWSLFFTILHIVTPFITKSVFPKWYASLSSRDRKDFPSYVVCTVHHIVMVPTAWYHVYQDFLLTPEMAANVQYAVVESPVAPFVIGYLVGDTLCYAIQEMFALRFEFIIHHVLTLSLVCTSLIGPGYFCRFIPHLIICDTTNIFFNIAWILRRCGFKGSNLVTGLELTFAFFFLLARATNLPVVFALVMMHPGVTHWGWARFTLAPIALMQWYWFSKIVSSMASKLLPSGGKKAKELPKTKPGSISKTRTD